MSTLPLHCRELVSGLSPERAFRALAGDENPFWLDSGIQMPRMGRYGIMGSDPFHVYTYRDGEGLFRGANGEVRTETGNPFQQLRDLMDTYRIPSHPTLPFVGGAVGYLAYDLCHHVERLPCTTLNDLCMPEIYMGLYDTALLFDYESKRSWVVGIDVGVPGRALVEERMELLVERASNPPATPCEPDVSGSAIECNFTRDEYLRAVQRAKDYIAAGDIFQVNLSRRFEARIAISPHELFLKLRGLNPAPMAAYLGFDDCAVVSASPERFLKVRDGHVETRPIKGTRPRSAVPEEDAALAEELLASEKDNAELAMIVDLERNDLGRVCSYGSVEVTEPRVLESFPTVHHLVATIEGDLHENCDVIDLLRATFPGGSITGAPKVRAMEIIDELEPTRRSVYTGSIGYLGFDGSLDASIVIRTFVIRGDRAWFQAGGGIVADSDLSGEYDETYQKARALIEAVA